VTIVFLLIHLTPGDPVELMLGEYALSIDKAMLRSELGLDQPILAQYLRFLQELAHADLGHSFAYQTSVLSILIERFPATLELAFASLLIAILIAFPLGIAAALRPNSMQDHLCRGFSLLGVSMPNFWLGPLLILIFSIGLNWLPVSGREGIISLILPALTLGTSLSGILSRMVRASLLDTLGEEYIRAAHARGIPFPRVILKHALKNSLLPVVTVLGLQAGALLSGAVITETIFSWPGVGRLLIQGIQMRDYPLVQGTVLFFSLSYLMIHLLVDATVTVIDPRTKESGKKS
jgi:peptide/nickel transport system permease protein